MFKRLVAIGLGVGAVITAIPAHADTESCAMRAVVVQRLQEDYSERLTAGGIFDAATETAVVEVWASPETGTFTVMTTSAQGVSCILATGTGWVAQGQAMPVGVES